MQALWVVWHSPVLGHNCWPTSYSPGARTAISHELTLDGMRTPPFPQIVVVWTQRCTWSRWWGKFGDVLGGYDRGRGDTLQCQGQVRLEMHLEAMIDQDWRSTWRWSISGRSIWRWTIWMWSIWRWSMWRSSVWSWSIWWCYIRRLTQWELRLYSLFNL